MVVDDLPDLDRRFGALARLYGVEGAARIRAACVVVVGIGGVGSWAAEALARSGVGQLVLVDLDHVAESNVNRQVHALTTTLGQSKVGAMRDRIGLIHPGCEVMAIEEFVEPANWPHVLGGRTVDAVIDACDQVVAKTAMAQWARNAHCDFISVGAAGGKRQAHRVDIDDLARKVQNIRCSGCGTVCASTMVRRARARRSAFLACSAERPCLRRTRRARSRVTVRSTATDMARW